MVTEPLEIESEPAAPTHVFNMDPSETDYPIGDYIVMPPSLSEVTASFTVRDENVQDRLAIRFVRYGLDSEGQIEARLLSGCDVENRVDTEVVPNTDEAERPYEMRIARPTDNGCYLLRVAVSSDFEFTCKELLDQGQVRLRNGDFARANGSANSGTAQWWILAIGTEDLEDNLRIQCPITQD